ncbi:MAG: RNA methyltransferase [Deltaproteobacteria bacterium]|nr:RNA methyltransferase [Deltaproteobacteria bacterium]
MSQPNNRPQNRANPCFERVSPGPTSPAEHILTGPKPVQEAIESRAGQIDLVLIQAPPRGDRGKVVQACREARVRFRIVERPELDRLFPGNHQGALARIFPPGYADLDEALESARSAAFPLVLALDRIQDPGNVGTLARTLYALGGQTIIVPRHQSSFLGDAARRASAGTLDRLLVVQAGNLAQALDRCRKVGFWVYGTALRPESTPLPIAPLHRPAVVLLGNEDQGIRPGLLSRCHVLTHVPMPGGLDSLNVAQAGAMVMYEFLRRELTEQGT